MARQRRNDTERQLWVENDEGLYRWHRQSRLSMQNFIRENRFVIDDEIDRQLNHSSE